MCTCVWCGEVEYCLPCSVCTCMCVYIQTLHVQVCACVWCGELEYCLPCSVCTCVRACMCSYVCTWAYVCAGVYISICIAKHITGMWLSCCIWQSLIISDYVVVSGRIMQRVHVCVATLLFVIHYLPTDCCLQTTNTSHSSTCLVQSLSMSQHLLVHSAVCMMALLCCNIVFVGQ